MVDTPYTIYTDPYLLFVITTRLPVHADYRLQGDRWTIKIDKKYQSLVNNILKDPYHCLLLGINQVFINENHLKPLPRDVIGKLPLCLKWLTDYDPLLTAEGLLVNLKGMDYDVLYNQLRSNVIEKLYQLY